MEACTNLNEAKAGQYVKAGTTREGVKRVAQIAKVWKDATQKCCWAWKA